MKHKTITCEMLDGLRKTAEKELSPKRFAHTCGVEKCAAEIGELTGFTDVLKLRAAALLHDITKEYSFEKQLKICRDFGIILRKDESGAPNILHAITAAAVIPFEYPSFDDSDIIGAVRWHATGRKDMTLIEKTVCLSDYIESGREYSSCVELRQYFFDTASKLQNKKDIIVLLDDTLRRSLEYTADHVIKRGLILNGDTSEAIESLKKIKDKISNSVKVNS